MDIPTHKDAANDTTAPDPQIPAAASTGDAQRAPNDAAADMPTPAAPAGSVPPAPTDQLSAGTLLGVDGHYRIERQLGRGGFCATYLAYDTQLQRFCVIKHLSI